MPEIIRLKWLMTAFLTGMLAAGYHNTLGQNPLAQTDVFTYSRNQYGAGSQNWAIEMDGYNRLFFANNEGLLVFNGKGWQLFPVPNKTIIRSIVFGPDGRLYAGAQDELGYFAPDSVGKMKFHSLKAYLPDQEKKIEDVWQVKVSGKDIFFRTDLAIYHFREGKMQVFHAASKWMSLQIHTGKIIAQDAAEGLKLWQNGGWKTYLPQKDLPSGFLITDLSHYRKDTSLLCTQKNGFFYLIGRNLIPFSVQYEGLDPKQHFTTIAVLQDHSFLAGSYFNGLYHFSSAGRLIQNVSGKNGLHNNTVRCFRTDPFGRVWMGLDNGIAVFEYRNPIAVINPPGFKNGVGYDVTRYKDKVFFALSTGIQSVPISDFFNLKENPEPPKNLMNGLSWKFSILQDQLFANRDDGLWNLSGSIPLPLSTLNGYWTFKPNPQDPDGQGVAGNYQGIRFFHKQNTMYSDKGPLPHFSESSRYLETDRTSIWVSHPYRGVFQINPSSGQVRLFDKKSGLPNDLNNHVFKIKNRILIATAKGIYEFDSIQGRMIKSEYFKPVFGDLPIRFLREDPSGNIWFVQEKMVGVADFSLPKSQIQYIPELQNKIVNGFENIFPFDSGHIFVGSDQGFFLVNYPRYKQKIKPFSVYLTLVNTIGNNDSTLFGGFSSPGSPIKEKRLLLPYKFNSIQFEFASTLFEPLPSIEFSYFLEGFDEGWCPWTTKSEKDYTNLPEGNYTFFIKARRGPTHTSSIFSFKLTINPPFYRTTWAYLVYALAIAGFLFAILKYQSVRYRKKQEQKRLADKKKFEEEQRQIAYRYQLELEKSEKEFIRLKNEKLEVEIEHKNAELASATMNLVQKKEFILKLKSELQQLQKTNMVAEDQPELKKLLKTLAEEEKLNKEWEHFARHFNSVYGDFLSVLKSRFPELKPHELQLCAYLRMNLSSKDIAPLLSISVRGVEIGRYRLRKKLNLKTEENLAQFLLSLGNKNS
jgi:ligand-binding sensor domain-containing protein/DNA-binding CsgD family transcriptional regulator